MAVGAFRWLANTDIGNTQVPFFFQPSPAIAAAGSSQPCLLIAFVPVFAVPATPGGAVIVWLFFFFSPALLTAAGCGSF